MNTGNIIQTSKKTAFCSFVANVTSAAGGGSGQSKKKCKKSQSRRAAGEVQALAVASRYDAAHLLGKRSAPR
jgi:hypothetical protein